MPFGNDCFTDVNKEYIRKGCEFFGKEEVSCSADAFCHYDVNPDLCIDIEPEIPEDKGISEVMYRQGSINTKI